MSSSVRSPPPPERGMRQLAQAAGQFITQATL
jgi:hypothetical protein